jgi:hypothetical protein
MENLNVLLIEKRKLYEITCCDIDDKHIVNVIHRNGITFEHHIELNINDSHLNNYRETYHKICNFDSKLKAMASYKLEELIYLCQKLNISIDDNNSNSNSNSNSNYNWDNKKKKTKKDIYQLLVQNY